MCIRDRGTARELARRVTRSGASALDSQTLADLGVEPDRTRLIGYTDDLGGLADDFLPVSYTHPDVYKRQA